MISIICYVRQHRWEVLHQANILACTGKTTFTFHKQTRRKKYITKELEENRKPASLYNVIFITCQSKTGCRKIEEESISMLAGRRNTRLTLTQLSCDTQQKENLVCIKFIILEASTSKMSLRSILRERNIIMCRFLLLLIFGDYHFQHS